MYTRFTRRRKFFMINIIVILVAMVVMIFSTIRLEKEFRVSVTLHELTNKNYEALAPYEFSEGYKIHTYEQQLSYDEVFKETLNMRETYTNSLPQFYRTFAIQSPMTKIGMMFLEFTRICLSVATLYGLCIFDAEVNRVRAERRNNH